MYESFYQFNAAPFQLSPDPSFFFGSEGHKRALAYLRYGIRQGDGFIIITGDVGTGKTLLLNLLLRHLLPDNVVAGQIVTTQMEADDLLRFAAAGFDLPYEGSSKGVLLRRLEEFFRGCVAEGKRVLLVVDEAQNLPRRSVEEIRMLSNFHEAGRPLLQTYLVGQREFRSTLRGQGFEQLRQRVIAAYHLKPLTAAETKEYVLHRLKHVGWNDDPRLHDGVFQGVHEFTKGVPRRINTFCDRLLLYGAMEELHEIGPDDLRSVAEELIDELGDPPENAAGSPSTANQALLGEIQDTEQIRHGVERRKGPEAADSVHRDRISAVENSMVAIAETMREELALLRQIVLKQSADSEKKK